MVNHIIAVAFHVVNLRDCLNAVVAQLGNIFRTNQLRQLRHIQFAGIAEAVIKILRDCETFLVAFKIINVKQMFLIDVYGRVIFGRHIDIHRKNILAAQTVYQLTRKLDSFLYQRLAVQIFDCPPDHHACAQFRYVVRFEHPISSSLEAVILFAATRKNPLFFPNDNL